MELKTLRQIIVQNVQHEPHIVKPEAIKYFLSGEWPLARTIKYFLFGQCHAPYT
jgi:hypothetical protein